MKFNRLRLLGFKSFVEPGEFVIERGLTGVVGPNGCGKSNLVEALRWVMGESSYKNMRASGMDDVIFSGSATRPVAQHRRSDAVPRQYRPHRARRLQRCRRIAGVAPHRARGRLDLPHQRQGSARQGRAAAVRRPVDRRALALDGRAGPHRRADPGQAAGAPRAARRGGRHFRPAHAAATRRSSAARRRAEPRAARRRRRRARRPDRKPEAPGAPGVALQEPVGRYPQGRGDAAASALDAGQGAGGGGAVGAGGGDRAGRRARHRRR